MMTAFSRKCNLSFPIFKFTTSTVVQISTTGLAGGLNILSENIGRHKMVFRLFYFPPAIPPKQS
jgi:hypothetical protein